MPVGDLLYVSCVLVSCSCSGEAELDFDWSGAETDGIVFGPTATATATVGLGVIGLTRAIGVFDNVVTPTLENGQIVDTGIKLTLSWLVCDFALT